MNNTAAGKALCAIVACAIILSMLGSLPNIVRAAGNFNIGDTVEVTTNLNVRTGPGTSYSEISDPDYPGYAPQGTKGEVLDGPTNADGYTWWKVDFGPGLYSGWSVEGGLEKVVSTTVSVRIDSYSPSSRVEVTVGGSTTISVTFTNTGNTAWNFITGATVWDSGGNQVANYSKTLSSALQPGQQTAVSWPHPVNQEGDYWLQFGVWKATPYTSENLLDKKPSPSQNLIRGVVSSLPDLVVTNIEVDPSLPTAGGSTTIAITIRNQGNANAIQTFFLEFYFDGTYKGHVYVDGLASGASSISSWSAQTWPSDTNPHTIRGVVDPDNTVAESDNGNNELSRQFTAAVNQLPTCSISANPRSGDAPLIVTFSISASDSDGSISAWVLDVDGDGNADYSGTGVPPSTKTHTYTNPGTYSVALMVSDNNGANASDTETVNVGTNDPPTCSLTATPRSGNAPLAVTFSMSASDSDGSISAWALDADGDGNTDYSGSGSPPSTKAHTYTNPGTYTAVLMVSDNQDATASGTETISVSPGVAKPDLVIEGITWSPTSPSIGQTVTFTVTIKNQGTGKAGSSKVYYFIDDIQDGYDYVSSIDPGATTTETFTWKAEDGSHAIKAVADYKEEVAESDETNNEKTVTYSATALSDLVINDITWTPANPSIGDTVTFTVTIQNQGTGEAGNSKVYYFIDNAQQGYDYVDSIGSGAATTESFTWKAEEGLHTIKAVADHKEEVAESDETNNEKIITFSVGEEIVSVPNIPSGPRTGTTGTSYSYSTGGASSSYGHNVEYRFDWGDGSYSSWSSSASASHSWSTEGTYTIRAQARCALHTDVVSDWSSGLTVDVKTPQTVSVEIVGYNAAPRELEVGNTVKLTLSFINTGNTPWTFYAAASLRKPDGTEVNLTLKPVSLDPDAQGTATWSYAIDMEGGWDLVFGIWKEQEQVNSLGHTGWLNNYITGMPLPSIPRYTLTIPYNPLGTISLSPKEESFQIVLSPSTGAVEESIFYYKAGTEVTLIAEPASEDYVFAHWGGDYVAGSRNPETIVMDSDKGVTAYFQQITSGLEVANFNYWSELIALREAVQTVLLQARGNLEADEEQKRSLLTRADALISKIERGHPVRYPVREGGPTIKHQAINAIVGLVLQFPKDLLLTAAGWGAEVVTEAVTESLTLGELGLLNIKEAGQGVIYIAYKKDSQEIWVNINLYDPVGQIYMFIPVEVERKEVLVPEWEHDWLPGSPKAMMTTGSALEIHMTPTMDDIRVFFGRDALVIVAKSPVELRVYDSQGRVTGIVNGEIKEEIPNSGYYESTVTILSTSDSYSYQVTGTGEGSYGLTVTSITEEAASSFSVADAPISTRAVHQYTIDWDALAEGEKGVTMKIDSDGDGTFEDIKYLGQEGIGFSWVWVALVGLSALLGVLVGAFMVRRRMSRKQVPTG